MATKRKRTRTTRRRRTRRNPARALLVNPRRRRRSTRRRTRRATTYRPARRTYRRKANARKKRRTRRSTRRSPVIVYRNAPRKRVTRRRRRRSNPSMTSLLYLALSAGGGFFVTKWGTEKLMGFFPSLYAYPYLKPIVEFGLAYGLYKYGRKMKLPANIARAAAVGAGAAAVIDAIELVRSSIAAGGLLPMTQNAVTSATPAQGALMSAPSMGALLSPSEQVSMGALMSSDMSSMGMGY